MITADPRQPTAGTNQTSPSGPSPSGPSPSGSSPSGSSPSGFDARGSDGGGSDSRGPAIRLPKGGGAIRGIGDKFTANPVTGTGSMSVPIPTSSGRSGVGPQLSLSYDSGAGNSSFGYGWGLSLPSITRKTDKGLPQYFDADVFILSGSEDLVPVYRQDADGSWVAGHPGYHRDPDGLWVRDQHGRLVIHEDVSGGFRVRRYQPRIEGLFARIERWSGIDTPGDVHWRSLSADNVLTLYGFDADSRIADPLDPSRIFSWLTCETRDDKGNAMLYGYKAEDGRGVDLGQTHERNRGSTGDVLRTANRYLKRIQYGNRTPLLDNTGTRPRFIDSADLDTLRDNVGWMFEVVFDYGDHDADAPEPDDDQKRDGSGWLYPWKQRPDPFSSYRSGFEVRTARLCQRVLMYHHFPGEAGIGTSCLVRSTDFTYSDELDPTNVRKPVYTFLRTVTQTGYRRSTSGYDKRGLPPVEFEYSQPIVQDTVDDVDTASLENLPIGVDGTAYRWTDLHGEGIPGILIEQAGGWYYKRNLSPIPVSTPDGHERVRARFAPLETVAPKPNVALADAQFIDFAGDGQPDVVVLGTAVDGLYEHDAGDGWQSFRPFTSRLNLDLRDPNLVMIDLNGDGLADVLISDDDAFVWHPSLAEDGFGPSRRVTHPADEEKGPRVVFADGEQAVFLADLSGDGLTDIARIRNGEVSYWPNLGYGRFGAKVTMDNAPWLDHPDHFDPRRIRLADIDGSGTTDIIYLHGAGIRLYFNQSGNSWSQPQPLRVFPGPDDLTTIVPTDLLGNGTTCLVWSSPLPADSGRPMRYVNLMGGPKPHLLVGTINNLGAETRVEYAPSTKFYLQDRRAGKRWIARLQFPVHVVERVETYDHVSRNRFVTRYAYHHGYFDSEEREFRGFGMVEQWDTEDIPALTGSEEAPPGADAAAVSPVPPVVTRTWFHTGVHLGHGRIADHVAEYFREDAGTDTEPQAVTLPDSVLPAGLPVDEEREACRAAKGMMLHQEIYALDGSDREPFPYTVTEQNLTIRRLQARGANQHAVFFTHPRETLTFHYERNPADPRVQHALTLEVDAYGNVLKEASISYGRRTSIRVVDAQGQVQQVTNPGLSSLSASDRGKQTTSLLTYTEHRVTEIVESADTRRNPLPCETRTFELTGYLPTGPAGRLQASDLVEPDPDVPGRLRHRFTDEVAYEAAATDTASRRPIRWLRTLYRRDDLSGPLPLGEMQALALPFESYQLAFTPGLLARVFQRPRAGRLLESLLPDPGAVLGGQGADQGGYLRTQTLKADGRFPTSDADDHWWLPSGRSFFSENATDNAAGAATELAAAQQHFFLPRRYRDPFGQDTTVRFDSYDLLMVETRDPVGNLVTVALNDYRVLKPRLVVDANGNRSKVSFDTLGMVAGHAVMGKALPARVEGDTLTGFVADPTPTQLAAFFDASDPRTSAPGLLRGATTRVVYDLDRFRRTRAAHPADPTRWQPVCAATLVREAHVADLPANQASRIQASFSYSDGFGREIQRKLQAGPGPVVEGGPVVNPRWVASGWTIFNNKGKPVRTYEPFYSATHSFEFGVTVGVSAILFYDPAERAIATLHPDYTYEKVVFDPWQRVVFDVNDTVHARNGQTGDPRTDPDIGGYLAGYFDALPVDPAKPWQTWYQQRVAGARGALDGEAALQAGAHADTPTTVHFDVLGRPFLTVTRNRVTCAGHDLDGTEASLFARVELDIQGNERELRDAIEQAGDKQGRVVMRYAYDVSGNRIHQLSMDAGARWMLRDVAGRPIRSWDSRGHNVVTSYDPLRRPVEQLVRGTTPDSDPGTLGRYILVDRIEYGEVHADAAALNLRTRVYRHFDCAGIVTNARLDEAGNAIEAYDFKGNPLCSTRRLVSDYRTIPDWLLAPTLDDETFQTSTRYDALNRPLQSIAPHSNLARSARNVTQPVFNEANLLQRVDVWLGREMEPVTLLDPAVDAPSPVGVADVDYNARGQRLRIAYKNGSTTHYRYDQETFRLIRLYTRRGAAFTGDCDNPQPPPPTIAAPETPPELTACGVQNLHYTYDPAGNITHIRDDAQQTVYFRNRRVEPSNGYIYDAVYRLIRATGREHLGQNGGTRPPTMPDASNAFHTSLDHPGDGNVMGTYGEDYVHDAVGNLLAMRHRGSDPAHPGWSRGYTYAEAGLIEDGHGGAPLKTCNRLTRTTPNPADANPLVEPYQHDTHGNLIRMPHLGGALVAPNMHWDYRDRLRRTDLGGGTAFYVYDASGQRVRKVWEKAPGLTEERIYLGAAELFRKHKGAIGADTSTLERETLHVVDDLQRIARIETRTLDNAGDDDAPEQLICYQLSNHLGSTSLELDEQSQIISYEEYTPYGSTSYQAVRRQNEAPRRYRYAAKERDEETGLCYFGARFYAPWIGRWTSTDPAGLVDGLNLYCYVSGNPVRLRDETGMSGDPPHLIKAPAKVAKTSVGTSAGVDNNTRGDTAHKQFDELLHAQAKRRGEAPYHRSGVVIDKHGNEVAPIKPGTRPVRAKGAIEIDIHTTRGPHVDTKTSNSLDAMLKKSSGVSEQQLEHMKLTGTSQTVLYVVSDATPEELVATREALQKRIDSQVGRLKANLAKTDPAAYDKVKNLKVGVGVTTEEVIEARKELAKGVTTTKGATSNGATTAKLASTVEEPSPLSDIKTSAAEEYKETLNASGEKETFLSWLFSPITNMFKKSSDNLDGQTEAPKPSDPTGSAKSSGRLRIYGTDELAPAPTNKPPDQFQPAPY